MAKHNALLRWVGRSTLSTLGWKTVGQVPQDERVVLICAPHTSNWDFIYLLLISWAQDFDVSWVGKDTLFKPPFGPMMRALGGISVSRGAKSNQSGQVAEKMLAAGKLIVAIAPEGTRGSAPHWRSGFYHMAAQGDAVIALGFLDYASKVGGFGPPLKPTGDLQADFAKLAEFYQGKVGKFPSQQGPIQLAPSPAVVAK